MILVKTQDTGEHDSSNGGTETLAKYCGAVSRVNSMTYPEYDSWAPCVDNTTEQQKKERQKSVLIEPRNAAGHLARCLSRSRLRLSASRRTARCSAPSLHDHTRVVGMRIEAGIFGRGGMSVRSRAGGVKGKFCVVDKGGRGSPSCAPRSSPAASFSASIV